MDEIIKKIKDFKNLLSLNIDLQIVNDLSSHCKNGYEKFKTTYANNLQAAEWVELFNQENIKVDEHQITEFFEYMRKYYGEYFHKIDNKSFAVSKSFTKDRINNFEFETIVYHSIND